MYKSNFKISEKLLSNLAVENKGEISDQSVIVNNENIEGKIFAIEKDNFYIIGYKHLIKQDHEIVIENNYDKDYTIIYFGNNNNIDESQFNAVKLSNGIGVLKNGQQLKLKNKKGILID